MGTLGAGGGPGTMSAPATDVSSAAVAPPQVRFRVQLAKLQEMGFNEEEANITALLAASGSLNAAVERLLQQM
eukprot:COSAG05_NODE_43_length_25931_cov_49.314636_3_plen_73_part_00